MSSCILLSTGCVTEVVDDVRHDNTVYYAETEQDTNTRTSLGEDNALLWSAADEIAIFEKKVNQSRYILKEGSEGKSTGEFICIAAGSPAMALNAERIKASGNRGFRDPIYA